MDDLLRRKQRTTTTLSESGARLFHGQEPYTIAMQVAEALSNCSLRHPPRSSNRQSQAPGANPFGWKILASDINYSVLRTARKAPTPTIRWLPSTMVAACAYFDKVGDRYVVEERQGTGAFRLSQPEDRIPAATQRRLFCRNVMMYFDEAEQKRLVEKFIAA